MRYPEPTGGLVVVVCTGNQCRSPMAEALLRAELGPASAISVTSAGTAADGTPPPPEAVQVMADLGLDIAGRPGRRLSAEVLAGADLVVTMGRDHLVSAAALWPGGWEQMFTLVDLLERARRSSGRQGSESVAGWARRMSGGRSRQSILALPSRADVADPMGQDRRRFEETRDQLRAAMVELAGYLTGTGPAVPAGPDRPGRGRRWRRQ